MRDEERVGYFWHTIERIDRVAALTDNKAIALAVVNAGALLVAFALGPDNARFQRGALCGWLLPVGAILLALSTGAACLAIFPRVRPPRRGSVIYFGDIVGRPENDYVVTGQTLEWDEATRDLLGQIYANSIIVCRKLFWTRLSLLAFLLALAAGLVRACC